jgi:pyrimidine-nucleoside phosphorylase
VFELSARLLELSDLGIDLDEGRRRAEAAVVDGSATKAYERWIRAQGGDPDLAGLPTARVVREVAASRDGFVVGLGALAIGGAALELGAGRRTKEDKIDHTVGIMCAKKRGDAVERGDVLAEVHARDERSASAAISAVSAAYQLGDESPPTHGIVLDVVL